MKEMPLGPRTPWPNRADTFVRLFARQFKLLACSVLAEAELRNSTVQEMVPKTTWARNVSVTFSGKTPVELANGWRTPDMLDVENMKLGKLTAVENPLANEVRNIRLQRLALK